MPPPPSQARRLTGEYAGHVETPSPASPPQEPLTWERGEGMRTQRDLDSKSEEGGNSEEVTAGAWRWAPGGGGGRPGASQPSRNPSPPTCLPWLSPPPLSPCTHTAQNNAEKHHRDQNNLLPAGKGKRQILNLIHSPRPLWGPCWPRYPIPAGILRMGAQEWLPSLDRPFPV